MDTLITASATGIITGIASSLLWLWLLRRIRPRIGISPQVSEPAPNGTVPGQVFYIKIVNLTRRAAVDLKIELATVRIKQIKHGAIGVKSVIAIDNVLPLLLPGKRSDKNFGNAYRLRIGRDLRAEIESSPSTYLRLRIHARDEVSGMGRVFEQSYCDSASDIVRGSFSRGETYEIYG